MRTARAVSEQETNTARTVREPQGEKEFIAEGAPTGSGRRRHRGRREELEEFEGPEVVDVEDAEDAAVGVGYDDAGDFALFHEMEGSAGEFAGSDGDGVAGQAVADGKVKCGALALEHYAAEVA